MWWNDAESYETESKLGIYALRLTLLNLELFTNNLKQITYVYKIKFTKA